MMSLSSCALAPEWLQGVNDYLWISWRSQRNNRKFYKIARCSCCRLWKFYMKNSSTNFISRHKRNGEKSFSLCCAILSAFCCANFEIRFGSINSINVLKRGKKNIRTLPSAHELLSANLWRVAFIFHRFRSEVFLSFSMHIPNIFFSDYDKNKTGE